MTYFDNAATSFPKPEIVYEKLDERENLPQILEEVATSCHLKWTGRFLILE